MKRTLIVAAALVLVGAEPDKKELERMQGDWACESSERGGMRLEDDAAQSLFRTVKGDRYTVYRFRKKVGSGTFTLDATKSPKQIDFVADDGPAKGKTMFGIYKLEGDRLTLCYAPPGGKRPTAFVSKEEDMTSMAVWVREKK